MKKRILIFGFLIFFIFIPKIKAYAIECPKGTEYTGYCCRSDDVKNLLRGHWCEVSDSHMRDKAMKPWDWDDYKDGKSKCYDSYQGTSGVGEVIKAWSGGAYDTKRDRLIVWGGGGANAYGGNEIYAFDLIELSWKRLTDPSCLTADDRDGNCELAKAGIYKNGMPRSRHTYNYIQYVPTIDSFCSFGGQAQYPGMGCGTHSVHCFSFETMEWEKKTDTPCYGYSFSSIDPVTGHAWIRGTDYGERRCFAEYDPDSDVWTKRGDVPGYPYSKTAAIDPKRRLLVAVGDGKVWLWDIAQEGTLIMEERDTEGGDAILNSNPDQGRGPFPGFVYDPVSEKLVGWNGGADIYTLNLGTNTWAIHLPAATNMVVPTAPTVSGTYGRFRHSPNYNVFIVVNSVDENVYLYRLMPKEIDTTPPAPPTGLKVE